MATDWRTAVSASSGPVPPGTGRYMNAASPSTSTSSSVGDASIIASSKRATISWACARSDRWNSMKRV